MESRRLGMEIIEGKLKVTCCGNCCFSNYAATKTNTWISCEHPDFPGGEYHKDYTESTITWFGSPYDIPPETCPLQKGGVYVHLGEEIGRMKLPAKNTPIKEESKLNIPKGKLRILGMDSTLRDTCYKITTLDFDKVDFPAIPNVGDILASRNDIEYKVIRREFYLEDSTIKLIVEVD